MDCCKENRFYLCKICGNLIGMILCSGVEVHCCGEPMTQLIPNTVDASKEKHVPVITQNGNTVHVNIGSADHPMTEAHHIQWIYLETKQGGQRKCLAVDGKPAADFCLAGDELVSAYAYCNLHGLWQAKVE